MKSWSLSQARCLAQDIILVLSPIDIMDVSRLHERVGILLHLLPVMSRLANSVVVLFASTVRRSDEETPDRAERQGEDRSRYCRTGREEERGAEESSQPSEQGSG